MIKSFGDYNIERSSSSDINNIKWTQKNPSDTDKLKNKKKATKNTSSYNIIYTETQKVNSSAKKVFKVILNVESKNKKKKENKQFQTSAASNCNIEPGFTRKAR
ncbi:MAG TPA: hypothetical protein VLD64_06955 [Nitrosarchaeum sp.]|jgi:hypothetical protein|nr:hypothetical protein [Nitrosarchaeum sp.]